MKLSHKIAAAVASCALALGLGAVSAPAANAFGSYIEVVSCPAGTRYQYVVLYNSSGATIGINTSNGTSYAGSAARPAAHYHYTWSRTATYTYWGNGNNNFRYQYYCRT